MTDSTHTTRRTVLAAGALLAVPGTGRAANRDSNTTSVSDAERLRQKVVAGILTLV